MPYEEWRRSDMWWDGVKAKVSEAVVPKRMNPSRFVEKAPSWVHPRPGGESALFDNFEWIYAPHGLSEEAWKDIEKKSNEGHIRVIDWSTGMVVYDSQKGRTA